MDTERWIERFEQESTVGKAKLLGGTAVRLSALLLERGVERAATTFAEAERAFKRELDPNMEEAKILEERSRVGRRGGQEATSRHPREGRDPGQR